MFPITAYVISPCSLNPSMPQNGEDMPRLTTHGDIEAFENNSSSSIRMLGVVATLLFALLISLIFID